MDARIYIGSCKHERESWIWKLMWIYISILLNSTKLSRVFASGCINTGRLFSISFIRIKLRNMLWRTIPPVVRIWTRVLKSIGQMRFMPPDSDLRYVYTLRLIGPISYLGACYIRTKVTTDAFVRKWRCTFVAEPLNHIHQDTKSAWLIAMCKRSFVPPDSDLCLPLQVTLSPPTLQNNHTAGHTTTCKYLKFYSNLNSPKFALQVARKINCPVLNVRLFPVLRIRELRTCKRTNWTRFNSCVYVCQASS